ncbi:DMT family transporter [Spirochaetota bacterium]
MYTLVDMMHDEKSTAARYEALLFITAAIWGTGFVAQRLGMQNLGPFSYNAARFLVGAIALVPVLFMMRVNVREVRAALKPGLLAGSVLAVAAGLQQAGLQYTSAGKAGFITGLYVVFVPIAAIAFGKRTPLRTWIGAGAAVVGLYFLSFSSIVSINRGDTLVLIGALFWTAHILVLDRFASRTNPIALACVQFTVCSVFCWAGAIMTESPSLDNFVAGALPIGYGGVFSIGVAFTLQAIAQTKAHPARASIIMSLEALFAAIAGFLFLSERLGPRELLGCALMLSGTFVAQWPSRGTIVKT